MSGIVLGKIYTRKSIEVYQGLAASEALEPGFDSTDCTLPIMSITVRAILWLLNF